MTTTTLGTVAAKALKATEVLERHLRTSLEPEVSAGRGRHLLREAESLVDAALLRTMDTAEHDGPWQAADALTEADFHLRRARAYMAGATAMAAVMDDLTDVDAELSRDLADLRYGARKAVARATQAATEAKTLVADWAAVTFMETEEPEEDAYAAPPAPSGHVSPSLERERAHAMDVAARQVAQAEARGRLR